MAGGLAAYMYLPKLFGTAVDRVAETLQRGDASQGDILPVVLLILAISAVRGVLSFSQNYLGETLAQHVAYDLRNAFYDHVQRLSFAFHDRHHTGNLMSRAISDVENVRMFVNMGLVRTPYFVTMFVVVAVILLRMDWRLGLLSMSFLPVVAFQSAVVRLRLRQVWLGIQEKLAEMSAVLQENLTGVRVVKAFAAEDYERSKFDRRNRQVAWEMLRAERLRAYNVSVMTLAFLASIALILWFGGWEVARGRMTPGELAQFIFYMQVLALPVRMTGWLVSSYARAASAGQRLFEILDARSPVRERPGARILPRVRGHVRFEGVGFSYDGTGPVLRDVSFEARPGQVVALLGAPGSGKTSIVNLIPRFYDVTEGRVTIDGVDVRDVTLESLRRNIGIVQQDVFLFTDTIKENIAYGRQDASIEEVIRAAKTAQLHDFIMGLENGYETVLNERGTNLSGGQRQRLAIARALLLDPPILILDDSTSSVDARTEELIRRAMESVMRGRTTFVIAHRLSSVHRADLILVLKEGRIVERGTHRELVARGGLYREIYELQLRPQEEVMRDLEVPTAPRGGDGL